MSSDPRIDHAEAPTSILHARYRLITIGMFALIALTAFENLAVTTVMPTISRELHGSALYALAFAGPLAIGVLGMVIAGNWSDREGPRPALYASIGLFVAGLLITGTAVTMEILVVGRLIQGIGGGGLTVALYVIVARVYPERLQPSIFGAFAAAWVVPSLIGPFLAGIVAQYISWHWVFLGVVALAIPALAMVLPGLRGMVHVRQADRVPWSGARIGWAALATVAVLGLNLSARTAGAFQFAVPALAIIGIVLALRALFPKHALRAGRGLPSVILVRSLVSGGFFGAEVYVPLLLINEYGLSPALAGLALSVAGISWSFASWVQGRFSTTLRHRSTVRAGTIGVVVGISIVLVSALLGLAPWVIIAAWAVSGAGMGFAYPRLSVLTLSYSTPQNQGFNSSALSIADATGAAVSVAATAIVFAALAASGALLAIAGCFALALLFGLGGLTLSPRVAPRPSTRDRQAMSDDAEVGEPR